MWLNEYFWIILMYRRLDSIHDFKGLGMKNLQYEMRIFQKRHNKVTKTDYVYGSNFYGSDVTYEFCQFKVSTRLKNHTILYLQSHFWNRYHRSIWLWQLSYEDLHHFKTARNQTVHFFCPYFRHVSEWASFSTTDPQD